MKAVFFGTPEIAVPCLQSLHDAGIEIPLVVTQPDRPRGRSGRPVAPPVKQAALALGLTVLQPRRLRTGELSERIRSVQPDFLVVVAYGRILPPEVLESPRVAPVNVHFSLLPRYRGAAPVAWALARGESETGITTQWMNERLDEGDVLLQERVAIRPGEHAPELARRLSALAPPLLVRTLQGLEAGSIVPQPQDPALATYAPPLRKEDGAADFTRPAREVEGRVRGFDPWPGVWARGPKGRLRLVRAEATESAAGDVPPGTVIRTGKDLGVVCGDGGVLRLLEVQPEGRRRMSAAEAERGRYLALGERLERDG